MSSCLRDVLPRLVWKIRAREPWFGIVTVPGHDPILHVSWGDGIVIIAHRYFGCQRAPLRFGALNTPSRSVSFARRDVRSSVVIWEKQTADHMPNVLHMQQEAANVQNSSLFFLQTCTNPPRAAPKSSYCSAVGWSRTSFLGMGCFIMTFPLETSGSDQIKGIHSNLFDWKERGFIFQPTWLPVLQNISFFNVSVC